MPYKARQPKMDRRELTTKSFDHRTRNEANVARSNIAPNHSQSNFARNSTIKVEQGQPIANGRNSIRPNKPN